MATIFLVDDSATMLLSLKQILGAAGFTVETAPDGQAAFERLQAGLKPNLIITDINMPRMNGLDFIKAARTLVRFIPILALTTESQTSKRDEAKRNGATGWLVKPVDGNDLLKVIRQVMPAA